MGIRGIASQRPGWLAPLLVGFATFTWFTVARLVFVAANGSWLAGGFRVHEMSSNYNQQGVDIMDINVRGITFAWYTHVYPPLLDVIRYGLAAPEIRAGLEPSGDLVDMRLYWLYAALAGVVAAVVYLWVRDLTRSGWWALGSSALWAISPAFVTVMMLLEPFPLSVCLVTVALYLLYRFLKTRRGGYATGFLVALLLASWSRNVVQLHVMVVLAVAAVAFWWMSRNRTAWRLVLNVIIVLLIFFWPVRAFVMFGTWDVSTHTGYHRAGALWIDPRTAPEPSYPFHISDNALAFSSRFNTQPLVAENYKLGLAANAFMLAQPVEAASRLSQSLGITVPNALQPVTSTTVNELAVRLPWRAPVDWLLSGWRYVMLIVAAAVVICWSRGWAGSLSLLRRYGWFAVFWGLMAIPVAFSNRYWPPGSEDLGPLHTEAARLKALIEVPFYVLIGYAAWVAIGQFTARRRREAETRDA